MNDNSLTFVSDKDKNWDELVMEVFHRQSQECQIYKEYLKALKIDVDQITSIEKIPFLPIDFFKNHEIKSRKWASETVFKSSGTTQGVRSCHHVRDLKFYLTHSKILFEEFINVSNIPILALLPSYLEQGDSSLIAMVDYLIRSSTSFFSGFYEDTEELKRVMFQHEGENKPYVVFGVTYALLDFSSVFEKPIKNAIIIETGGMKGRGKELTRKELHETLKNNFGIDRVYSEYGMTELMSQFYSDGDEWFRPNGFARVYVRDLNDPFVIHDRGSGVLNIIDLGNIDTCCFVATNDVGELDKDGHFKVLGRLDNSDIRGCNLLYTGS